MKSNHNRDPLDQQIDNLLLSHPIKPSKDFATRVLATAETAVAVNSASKTAHPLGTLVKFVLPLAAAIAITISLWPVHTNSISPTLSVKSTTLSTAEVQEIFFLEESLASLADISTTEFSSIDLLSTLDALYLEI